MKIYYTFLLIILLCSLPLMACASYFVPPYPTGTSWDTIYGFITAGGSAFGDIGDEIAGYDASGNIRMWFQLTSSGQYGFVSFFDPSPDSFDTSTFTFRFYQASTMTVYALTADLSNWGTWQGGGGPFQVNMLRGDPTGVVPEPSTFLVLSGILGLGLFSIRKKRIRPGRD